LNDSITGPIFPVKVSTVAARTAFEKLRVAFLSDLPPDIPEDAYVTNRAFLKAN
jgi:hypothetical protein